METKRLTAYKVRIKDILAGKYVTQEGFKPNYILTTYGQKVSRVRVMAIVINKFVSNDSKYAFIVLEDGTESIRVKSFQDINLFENVKMGQIIDFIGKVREYDNEIYLIPEVIRIVEDPNIETLRKLEIMKVRKEVDKKRDIVIDNKNKFGSLNELKEELSKKYGIDEGDVENLLESEGLKEEKTEEDKKEIDVDTARKIVLKVIEELDKGEGVDYQMILEKSGLPQQVTENGINELLSEGSCYEPRAGKVKVL